MRKPMKKALSRKGNLKTWTAGMFGVLALTVAACAAPEESALPADAVETIMVDGIEVRTDGLMAADSPYRVDTVTFELGPGEGIEYKYRIEEGQPIIYSWTTPGTVRSEMHAEADDQAQGTAEFFEVILSTSGAHGTYTAPFSGIHGWYWQNLNENEPTTLTVRSAGFYSYAMEYRRTGQQRYEPAEVGVAQ